MKYRLMSEPSTDPKTSDAPSVEELQAQITSLNEANAKLEKKRGIEAEHRKNAEDKLTEQLTVAEQLQAQLASSSSNDEIEAFKAEYQSNLDKIKAERETEQQQMAEFKANQLKQNAVGELIGDKFISPHLVEPMLKDRLQVDGDIVRILDAHGQPSAMTMADLQKEFLERDDLKPLIKAPVGSGAGAQQSSGGGATKSINDMTTTEQATWAKSDPTAFKAAAQAAGWNV